MSDDGERHSPKEARARLLEQALEDTLQLYWRELKSAIEGAPVSICQILRTPAMFPASYHITLSWKALRPEPYDLGADKYH